MNRRNFFSLPQMTLLLSLLLLLLLLLLLMLLLLVFSLYSSFNGLLFCVLFKNEMLSSIISMSGARYPTIGKVMEYSCQLLRRGNKTSSEQRYLIV